MATPPPTPPFVPPDADLRDCKYMPLKGDHLFNSETWIRSSPEGRCAGLRLWWHGFSKEVPAGTLPDDDRLLSVYAGYGEAIRAWKKVKPEALRGWIKGEDGRLHHRFLGEIVCESWERRSDYREEDEARKERQRRWRERVKCLAKALRGKGVVPPKGAKLETLEKMCRDAGVDVSSLYRDAGVDVSRDAGEVAKKRREEKGREEKRSYKPSGTDAAAPATLPPPVPDSPAEVPSLPLGVDDDLGIPLGLDRSPASEVARLWNETAKTVNAELGRAEWPEIQKLTSQRRAAITARLKDAGGISGIKIALSRWAKDPWARGETERPAAHANWRFDFDYFLKEKSFTRIMERPHDDDPSRRQQGRPQSGSDPVLAGAIAARARRQSGARSS